MTNNASKNKKMLEHLKEMLGEEKFNKLVERFAGRTLYFSKKQKNVTAKKYVSIK